MNIIFSKVATFREQTIVKLNFADGNYKNARNAELKIVNEHIFIEIAEINNAK